MTTTPSPAARSDKPFSPACDRNRAPILEVLRHAFADRQRVLEIGSGTGQHAVHFAAALPQLVWQTSDRPEYLDGIRAWLDDAGLANTPPPIVLDVGSDDLAQTDFDAAFSANTLHIMAWPEVQAMFRQLGALLSPGGLLAIYGPFNRDGRYTSASNAEFDASLKSRAAHMGIRDLADVDALAARCGFRRIADHAMPANNQLVVWKKSSA